MLSYIVLMQVNVRPSQGVSCVRPSKGVKASLTSLSVEYLERLYTIISKVNDQNQSVRSHTNTRGSI